MAATAVVAVVACDADEVAATVGDDDADDDVADDEDVLDEAAAVVGDDDADAVTVVACACVVVER